jgi:hypothetical protein
MRCFIDQVYWSLVDYGTSAARLAGIILVLMAASFSLVSADRNNFEPTLLAEVASGLKANAPAAPGAVTREVANDGDWTVGERLWMVLRFHVPLVGAIVSEEWQPARQCLTIESHRFWLGAACLRSRDWFAIMLWINWILWPLFLPFIIHRLSRER